MILDKYNKKLFIKELNGDISEEYEIVLPLDEKDKKIQELENRIKEMEMKQSNGSINSKPTNEIKQSTTDDNKPGREHQSK